MGQVFFVSAQQVKGCGEDVEREVAGCGGGCVCGIGAGCEEGFVAFIFKTFYCLGGDAGFEEQGRGSDGEDGIYRLC